MERQRMDRLINSASRTDPINPVTDRTDARSRRFNSAQGFTLIEAVIALAVLGIATLGVAGVFALGAQTAHSQAELSQAVVVCQSKMEQLRSLAFNDTTSDTTQTGPPYPATGTGLAPGGSTTQAVSGYGDEVDATGSNVTQSAQASFSRWWQISQNGGGDLDTITVRCQQMNVIGPLHPDLTITTEKICDPNNSSEGCPAP